MQKDSQGWNIIDNLEEYEINYDLEKKIKTFLVNNAREADNCSVLMEMCFDEFDLEHEETHPICEWTLNCWIAFHDATDSLLA